MCGLVGGYLGEGTADLTTVRHMLESLRHRGPDDEGLLAAFSDARPVRVLTGPDSVSIPDSLPFAPSAQEPDPFDASFVVGHRRLAIRDLSASGHQPMCTPDRRYWIAYNGEIYNTAEVVRDLGIRGPLYGSSDTEILLRGYAIEGERILQRLNGAFAFALWDDRDKCLLLARDRLGIKPLYIARIAGGLWFASEIKALLAHDAVTVAPDAEAIRHALGFGVGARPRTWFDGIDALRQGHWMRIGPGGTVDERRYWSLPLGRRSESSFGAAVDEVDRHLSNAVHRRLVSDVPVGVYLSGGLDSGLVAAFARRGDSSVTALTLGFDEERDEVAAAAATAHHLGIRHRVCRVTAAGFLDGIEARTALDEEPNYSLGQNEVMGRFARAEGLTVVLNGLGGDELFAGYSYYQLARRWKWIRRLARVPAARRLMALRNASDGWLSGIDHPEDIHTLERGLVSEVQRRELFPADRVPSTPTCEYLRTLYAPVGGARPVDAVQAVSYMDLVNYIGNHHLARGDQYSMRHSVEVRFPFLDHGLVECAFAMPSEYKIRGAEHKRVLRAVCRRHLPAAALSAPKRGFSLPLDAWLRGPLREYAGDQLHALAQRDLFVGDTVRRLWAGFMDRRVRAQVVWQLAMTEQWFRTWIDAANTRVTPVLKRQPA